MPIEILMPALSPTMEEGNLAKWLKNEGDKIASGDVIAEIETDKATMEVEAVDEGTLGKILIPAGTEGVKVNTPIAVLLQDGESADAMAAKAPASAPAGETSPKANEAGLSLRHRSRRRHRPGGRRHRPRPRPKPKPLPIPTSRPAPRWCTPRCAKRFATPWPRRCAVMAMSS